MSGYQLFMTYACSWWLVLFMVLPFRVKIADKPQAGLAASAPLKPMLGKKFLAATLLAIIPTIAMDILWENARAAEPDMYHASSKCHPVAATTSANVKAVDKDATITSTKSTLGTGDTHMNLDIPAQDYTANRAADLQHTDIHVGDVSVSPDGTASLNGQPLTQQIPDDKDCK